MSLEKQINIDKLESLNKLIDVELLSPNSISNDLFINQKSKSFNLINNSEPSYFQSGKHIKYKFSLKEVIWVSKIIVKVENYSEWNKFEFTIFNSISSNDYSQQVKNEYVIITVNDWVDRFEFTPPSQWLSEPRLNKIEILGFTLDEFQSLSNKIALIDNYKNTIEESSRIIIGKSEAAEASISILIAELEDKKKKLLDIENDINITHEKRILLNDDVRNLESKHSDLITRIESLDDSIDLKKKNQQSLNSDIDTKQTELYKLESDINIFPSEISGFVSEGAKALRQYYILAIIPLFILAIVVSVLLNSSVNLTTVFEEKKIVDILSVMLTRLPFVLVSGMLITACYHLIKFFVGQMVKINQQRLNLNKISIIANDVSISSSVGLGLNTSEKYHARTKLKMDLLKEHLKEEISQNYIYTDKSLFTIDSEDKE